MIRFLLPIILLVASATLFFTFIDPTYNQIIELQKDEARFSEALDNSKQLQQIRDGLLEKYNAIPTEDIDRLEKMLPDTIDNVKLIRDIDGVANKYGMSLRNVKIAVTDKNISVIGPDTNTYDSVNLTFSVSGPYKTFIAFLHDMESSLRLVDVVSIKFSSSKADLYEYNVTIKTYWLK